MAYAPGYLQITQGPDGMYQAVNPKTGQLEPVYNDNDTSQMYFKGDQDFPSSAQPAGAPQYFAHDWGSGFDNFMGNYGVPLGLGAIAGAGALGLGAGAGTGASLGAADAAGGLLPEYGTTAAYNAGIGGTAVGSSAIPMGEMAGSGGGGALDALGLTNAGTSAAGMADWSLPSAVNAGLLPEAGGILSGLSGAGGTAGGGGNSVLEALGLGSVGSLLGGLKGMIPGLGGFGADKALALAPVIAAIAHARSQGPFDTSRFEDLYSRFDPNALAYNYDINTGLGRNALNKSLTDRGVLGSSFGNMDLTNYNTNRELGRSALVNQGVGQAEGLAGDILNAQMKQRALSNDLYGRSLLALGNIFGGRG